MKLNIMEHNYQSLQPIKIDVAEEKYGAKFIGDFCIKTPRDGWTDFPVAIFYQPNPKTELGHTHYFGLFVNDSSELLVTNGESAFSDPITGLITDDGTVIYSRYRHDYVSSNDGKLFIDGGRDYCRIGGKTNRLVRLLIDKDKLVIDPESINEEFKKPEKRRTTLTSTA